ncbi:MAG: carbamoyl-phosphate synthase large subunit [Oscillospiraceae bacterium]|jgi:carbamoyl-phosphate synthase large subunit|nr:carbamoyl-phosphate synthase large subunit [Oscillospiraceae bacterium]
MPRFKDISKILVIGSGPIVIGQGAEFDYAGTQACLALKELDFKTILLNSNPATIMTDQNVADKVYMEPLTFEFATKIINKEQPDAILPTMGGQTSLNLTVELCKKGVLQSCGCKMLGVTLESIEKAEDREKFKDMCKKIGEPCIESGVAKSYEEAIDIAEKIGYPVVLRPAFTLAGTGGGFASNSKELQALCRAALDVSPIGQVLVEKSVKGYKEIEYEVMRDSNDTTIAICNMENFDPVGVHTGDSIVVCPSQTLTNREYHTLRSSALKIVKELGICGGCNVQFALDPESSQYFIIEINPRVSRSSALASKASGYPIARVAAMAAVGLTLDEIRISNTCAAFEPALDYIVTKIPRFPFDKFPEASRGLSTQMKSVGEIMALGRTFEESFLKALRGLETKLDHVRLKKLESFSDENLLEILKSYTDELLFALAELLRRGISPEILNEETKIDKLFIFKIKNIIDFECKLCGKDKSSHILKQAKKIGFSDSYIAHRWGISCEKVIQMRRKEKIYPVYKMIDTCASEFESYIPYFYATYNGTENESKAENCRKIIVLGSGAIRIGQGIEFDYSTVHAVWELKKLGIKAIVINNNPSTVSTDYTLSDKLYFEPVCTEDVINIIDFEQPEGVIVTLGGQTAINIAEELQNLGVKIIGTGASAIKLAENRKSFDKLISSLGIPRPEGRTVISYEESISAARDVGYPVLVRPSFVLGGRAMRVVYSDAELSKYMREAQRASEGQPVLIDKYIQGKELEVDAVCDGFDVFIPGIMEHVEKTGIHSGDSISVYPTFSVSEEVQSKIFEYTKRLGLSIGIKGPFNVQFIVDKDEKVYVIELNPRSSRTVPFISKACGVNLAQISAKIQAGYKLDIKNVKLFKNTKLFYVKVPVFSFAKILGVDSYLSAEMKSTGEAIGYDETLNKALYKALIAAGMNVSSYGSMFVSVADSDKLSVLPLVKRFYSLGFNVYATFGTHSFLVSKEVKSHMCKKMSEGSREIESVFSNGVIYAINTVSNDLKNRHDGFLIRRCAIENNVSIFTSLETVQVLLNALEEISIGAKEFE